MSANDIDRTLAEWFEDDALAATPADGLDRALAGVRRHRPRPAWLAGPGSHWGWTTPDGGSLVGSQIVPRSAASWWGAAIAVLVLGALLGGAILVGARFLDPSPRPTSAPATSAPATSAPPTSAPATPAPTISARLTVPLGHLAYTVDGDVFVADGNGGNAVRVADGLPGGKNGCGSAGYWAEAPMWSPDGHHFAYRSGRRQVGCGLPDADTFPRVLISDPAGNVVAEVPGVGWLVSWSPDSTRFATWLDLYPSTKIGIYGLDGVRQTVLTMPPGELLGDFDPIWSPDGASLLVPLSPIAGDTRDMWELPIDGSPPRPVEADDPRSNRLSRVSPDGTLVASVVGPALIVADADGSQPRELVKDGVSGWANAFPVWSPDGDRIAFTGGTADVTTDLQIVDVATGSATHVAEGGSDGYLSVIAFSPDGDRILYARFDNAAQGRALWSVRVDGSDPRLLVLDTLQGDWQTLPPDDVRPGG